MISLINLKKKLIFSLPLFILMMIALPGCTDLSKQEVKNPSVKEINEKIKQSVDISTMKVANYAKFKKVYGVNREEIEEFVLYRAPSNIKADEIVIIKVKDVKQINNVKEKILKRVEKQATSFKDYLPEEYFLIEKRVITVKNNYIILVISKDAEKIASVFDECFK